MKTTADVVVIGGGVHGCAMAYYLAKLGCRDVVVVEQDQVASGASGRCPCGFRHQFGIEANIRLVAASIQMFLQLQEELESPIDPQIQQCGYIFLASSEQGLEQYRKNVQLQRSLGIPSEVLDPQQTKSLVPWLNTEQVTGSSYCPSDGRANPFKVTLAYALAAQRLGVQIESNTRVQKIATSDSRVTGVVTDKGTIEAAKVVCVAGANTTALARTVGVELPITPRRHQMTVSERIPWIGWPVTISILHQVSLFQTLDGNLIMGRGGPTEVKEFTSRATWQSVAAEAKGWEQIAPPLLKLRVLRQWAGTYDMTPDANPALGPIPGVEGFYVAAGWSGHGFMFGPISGKTMAQTILGLPTSEDISHFDPSRFERGELVIEPMVK